MSTCSKCGAFVRVSTDGDGMGVCLASGQEWPDYDKRGIYEMVAWCDGCSCFSDTLDGCLRKREDLRRKEEVAE